MPTKKPHQGEPLRGGDNLKVTENGFQGQVPGREIASMESELRGLKHGEVSLTVVVRDGLFQYSRLTKTVTRCGAYDE